MPTSALLGRIVDPGEVEDAVIATLDEALPFYLAEVERQRGMDPHQLGSVQKFATAHEPGTPWAEDDLPGVLVVCSDTDDVIRDGHTAVRIHYPVDVGIVLSGSERHYARRAAQRWGAAVAACLEKHGDLDGFAHSTRLVTGPQVEAARRDESDVRAQARLAFVVDVPGALRRTGKPRDLNADPYATPDDPPAVEQVEITVEPMESP